MKLSNRKKYTIILKLKSDLKQLTQITTNNQIKRVNQAISMDSQPPYSFEDCGFNGFWGLFH